MDTWRIQTQLNDKSASVGSSVAFGIGATVIPASRGSSKPVKINKGETERIKQLYKADRYEVLEAIAYNTKYPLWISAPSVGGAQAGILFTNKGLKQIPFVGEEIDLKATALQSKAGVSNGATAAFSVTFKDEIFPEWSTETTTKFTPKVHILVDGKLTEAACIWNGVDKKFDLKIDTIGEGTITHDTDKIVVTFSFQAGKIPAEGKEVSIRLTSNLTTLKDIAVYALIGMRYPCEDYMGVAIYKSENEGNLMLSLKQLKKGILYSMTGYPREFSLKKGTTNASGLLIYAQDLFKNDDNIFVKINEDENFIWSTFTTGTKEVTYFKGGYRGVEPKGSDLVEAWDQFKDIKRYSAEIYFDTTAKPEIPAAFVGLRTGFAKYKKFLFPQPVCTADEMLQKIPLGVSNMGLVTFWGAAYIQNIYEDTGNLISTLMGEVAAKYTDALVYSYGGRAVAWSDENSVGGQLSMGRIVEFVHTCTEDQSLAMDNGRVNPIQPNELFGPIVCSRRSTDKSSGNYSYADYAGIVDYCVERIYNEVLPYQLVKFNDDVHRAIVRSKADLILKPLTVVPNNVIREYAIKCDSENNGDDVLAREDFVLSVGIKVTTKSRMILFNFINSAAGASVEEDVK